MKTFKQYLEEGRDAPLYHGTTIGRLERILNANKLVAGIENARGTYEVVRKNVSFTRKYRFAYEHARNSSFPTGKTYAIIEIDQRKLNQNYKLMPFNFFNSRVFNLKPGSQPARADDGGEFEEYTDRDVTNLQRYITAIYVDEDEIDKLKPYIPSWAAQLLKINKESTNVR